MGCCFSSTEGPNSPYPGGANSASARAINAPAQTSGHDDAASAVSPTQHGHSPHHRRRSHHEQQQDGQRHDGPQELLAQHINKPLRRHEWTSKKRIWTRRSIDRERIDFFDTRVTGRPEIWQTLHAALEILWEDEAAARRHAEVSGQHTDTGDESAYADVSEYDGATALATAQSILTAADITLPSGDLASGAYDAFGNYYQLPGWVVCDPLNIREEAGDTSFGDAKAALSGDAATSDEGGLAEDDELERRREEKGKAVAVMVGKPVRIRVRMSETARDIVIDIGEDDTVRSLARRIREEAGLSHATRIRIAYLGKIMKENSSLHAQGWKEGHVVNAFMFDTR